MKRNVRLFRPDVGEAELAAIREVFDRQWLGLGPTVSRFERAWAEYVGVPTSVGVNSATAALHLALARFEFAPGSKVLVPALTFASTATAALYNGLEPVFVDCDPETLQIDVDDARRKVTSDTVAIVPVHFGGYPAPMDAVLDLAAQHGLKVVEDCAHCAGGVLDGRKLGTIGDIGCFSFEEKKCMTTGDGGMLSARDPDLIEPLRAHRWIGIDKDTWRRAAKYTDAGALEARHWHYEIAVLGYKYNMNDLAAAIGLVQLDRLDAMNRHRRRAVGRYLAGIADLKSIRPLLPYRPESEDSYWIFGVRVPDRDALIPYLKERGIATGVHYMPLPRHPLFRPFASNTPVLDSLWEQFVTLPLHAGLQDEEIDYVVEALVEFETLR